MKDDGFLFTIYKHLNDGWHFYAIRDYQRAKENFHKGYIVCSESVSESISEEDKNYASCFSDLFQAMAYVSSFYLINQDSREFDIEKVIKDSITKFNSALLNPVVGNDITFLQLCLLMLFEMYLRLAQYYASINYQAAVLNTFKEYEKKLNEYKGQLPIEIGNTIMHGYYYAKALLYIIEGVHEHIDRFDDKKAKEFYGFAKNSYEKLAELSTEKKNLENSKIYREKVIPALVELGDGSQLECKGQYNEASDKLKKSNELLTQSNIEDLSEFADLALAEYYMCIAMDDELNCKFAKLSEYYKKAHDLYISASEKVIRKNLFDNTNYRKLLFKAECADSRMKNAKTRPMIMKKKQQKGLIFVGMLFFILWIISSSLFVSVLKYNDYELNILGIIGLCIICFVGSLVSSTLIKPKEALEFFKEIIKNFKPNKKE